LNTILHFTLTYEDFAEFQKIHGQLEKKRSTSLTISRGMLGWLLVLAVLVLLFVIFNHEEQLAPPTGPRVPTTGPARSLLLTWLINLVPWGLIALVVWFFFIRKFRGAARQSWDANVSELTQPRTAEITPDYIRFSMPTTIIEQKWTGFRRLAEGPTIFAVYTGPTAAHIIPKRAFASPNDIAAFRGLAQSLILEATGGFPVLATRSAARADSSHDSSRQT